MASIRTVSWTFEIDPRMMHTSSYINRRMIGGCCDSALFKVETSAPLGDSLIHTQTWQFIMTCWDGFGSDLLEKLVWIIQDHVIFMHVRQVCDYFVIQPRSFPPVGRVFTDSPWSRALHGRGQVSDFLAMEGVPEPHHMLLKKGFLAAFGGIHKASFFEFFFLDEQYLARNDRKQNKINL